MKIPNYKSQITNKSQWPKFEIRNLFWSLNTGIWDLIVIWCLGFGIWKCLTIWRIDDLLFTVYRSLLTAYRLLSLPLIRFLLSLGGSIFYWPTLIGHSTLPEGIGSDGFSDRRLLSFVRTVYYLHHDFPTQTEQPRCSGTRNSSGNRNCTVLPAKPSTWLHGRISRVSRNHSSLLPRANVERDSAGGKEDCGFGKA